MATTYACGKDVIVTVDGESEGIMDITVDLSATAVDIAQRAPAGADTGYIQTIQGMRKRDMTMTVVDNSPAATKLYTAFAAAAQADQAVTVAVTSANMTALAQINSKQFTVVSISNGQPVDGLTTLDCSLAYYKN